jgi:acetate kinase
VSSNAHRGFRVLTINAGSSSVKFGVFDVSKNQQLFKSEFENVISIEEAIKKIPETIRENKISALNAVGHRVAHGGEQFRDAHVIDLSVIKSIEQCVPLAPLRNPPALAGIQIAGAAWPGVPQVAVFDTAFHQTIPDRATTYAVPQSWRETGLRRYGFHGTSHKYVMLRVAEELGISVTQLRIISCHLGNGASVCAIERGASVDTSMGMTALEGLVMGTRSGDIDPGLFAHLKRTLGLSVDKIEHALYQHSGLAALSGSGNDMRDIEKRAAEGDKSAQLAIQVYAYRVRKYIGAYAATMAGFDVLAFTGGIGENSASMRRRICTGFEFLGLALDEDRNANIRLSESEAPQIQSTTSRVRVIVTQTREQWMIAQEVARVLKVKQEPVHSLPPIPVAVSAHHVHLTEAAVEKLFGAGYRLTIRNHLSQPGYWAAGETVDLIGPRSEIRHLRVLGPCRTANQIEITETEAYKLGIDVPLRLSGDTKGTPIATLRGPKGSVQTEGLIVAKRHIHMNAKDAEAQGLKQGDVVEVAVDTNGRDLVFRDVLIRTGNQFVTEMHIDTDEANAAHFKHDRTGELARIKHCIARITQRHASPGSDEQSVCLEETQTTNVSYSPITGKYEP